MTKKPQIILIAIFAAMVLIGIALLVMTSGSNSLESPSSLAIGKRIGVVKIEGIIQDSEKIVRQLKKMRERGSVAAVVLRVNSPGGGVAASQEIFEEVRKFRGLNKKCIVSMSSVAASGGYYLSCPAHTLFANPGTVTGSIGVIYRLPYTGELMKKIGIGSQIVKSGRYKDTGTPLRKMTPQERKLLQGVVDDSYNQFIEAIAESRDLLPDSIIAVCDGRILTGRQALKWGLVDTLGTFEDAIQYAAGLAGIEGKPKIIEPEKESRSLRDFILGGKLSKFIDTYSSKSDMPALMYQLF